MNNVKSPIRKKETNLCDLSIIRSLISKLQLCKSPEDCKDTIRSFENHLLKDGELSALLTIDPLKNPQSIIESLSDFIARRSFNLEETKRFTYDNHISPSTPLSPLTPQFENLDMIDPFPLVFADQEEYGDLKNELKKIYQENHIDSLINGISYIKS